MMIHGGNRRLRARAVLVSAAIAAGAFGLAGTAQAQPLDAKYWLEVSGYFPRIETEANVARAGQPGTDIDFESDLGLDKNEVLPAIQGGARWGRWVVTAEYYGLDRNSSRTVTRDLTFDGVTYPASAMVSSKMRSDIYRLTVGYAFVQNDQFELGAGIGLHATDFNLELSGNARVGTNPGVSTQRRGQDFVAPLPTVGVFGTWQATPQVTVTGRAEYLSLDIGDYGGGITNVQAGIAYRFNPTFEVGAGWRYLAYDLDVKKDYTLKLDYDFSGPSVFLRMGFR